MEALRVEGLSKNFGGICVLQGLSFSVEVGERLAIIGPNGAGKTTLLNVLSGELPVTSGRVYIFGEDITTVPTDRRVRLGLARSFQINNLFFNLTLLDNVLLGLKGIRSSPFQMFRSMTAYNDLFAKAQELLELSGLWGKRELPVKALSYGEQRQLEVVLSLASKPKVLLLDEPSAGLSIAESAILVDIIRNLAEDTTVCFCAHDMDIVFCLANRIVVLFFGRIIAQGTPQEIQADSTVKEIYLGSSGGYSNAGAG